MTQGAGPKQPPLEEGGPGGEGVQGSVDPHSVTSNPSVPYLNEIFEIFN